MSTLQATKHFSIEEMIGSTTADRNHIDNTPTDAYVIDNIEWTAQQLEIIRKAYDKPIVITSWYRSPELNAILPGSAKESYHQYGLAVDIRWDNELFQFLQHKSPVAFQKLIVERSRNAQWMHLQFSRSMADNNRRVIYKKLDLNVA